MFVEFKSNFHFQETEERVDIIHKKHVGVITMLDRVNFILWKSNDIYNSSCTSGKWSVIGIGRHAKYLWNYGGSYGINFCKKWNGQKEIADNEIILKKNIRNVIIMVAVILAVNTKGRSGEIIKRARNVTLKMDLEFLSLTKSGTCCAIKAVVG